MIQAPLTDLIGTLGVPGALAALIFAVERGVALGRLLKNGGAPKLNGDGLTVQEVRWNQMIDAQEKRDDALADVLTKLAARIEDTQLKVHDLHRDWVVRAR